MALLLEDLNPKLFNALGAAVRSLGVAQNDEDLAQVGVSGRRYIEQLADAFFPPQNEPCNGRNVTKDKIKNRLWAYIDSSIPQTVCSRSIKVKTLGQEIDRLIEEMNTAVHGRPGTERLVRAFGDLARITVNLVHLNPNMARKPYIAFEENIEKFLNDYIADKIQETDKSRK